MKAGKGINSRFVKQLAESENIVTKSIKKKIQEVQSDEGQEVYQELDKRNSRWPLRQYEWEQLVNRKVVEINRRNLSVRSLSPDKLEELVRMAEAKAEDVISFADRQINHRGLIYHTHVRLELDKLIASELGLKQLKTSDFPYPLQSNLGGEQKKGPSRADSIRGASRKEPEIVKKMRRHKYICLHSSGYNLEVIRIEGDRVIVKAQNGIEMPILFDRVEDYKWIRS